MSSSEAASPHSDADESNDEELEASIKEIATNYYFQYFEERRVRGLPWRLEESKRRGKKKPFRRRRGPWFHDEDPEILSKKEKLKEKLKMRLGLPPYPPRVDKLVELTRLYNEKLSALERTSSVFEKSFTPLTESTSQSECSSKKDSKSLTSLTLSYEYDDYYYDDSLKEESKSEIEEERIPREVEEEEVAEHLPEEIEEVAKGQTEEVEEEEKEPDIHPLLMPMTERNPDNFTYNVVFLRSAMTELDEKGFINGWIQGSISSDARKHAARGVTNLADVPISVVFMSALRSSFVTLKAFEKLKSPARFKIIRSWRLNGRHMGDLSGSSILSLRIRYGEIQTKVWLDDIDFYPPPLRVSNPNYLNITEDATFESDGTVLKEVPESETVLDVMERTFEYWKTEIVPVIKSGVGVLVITEDVNIRGIVRHLLGFDEETAAQLRFLQIPLKFELTPGCGEATNWEYLGDEDLVEDFCNLEYRKGMP